MFLISLKWVRSILGKLVYIFQEEKGLWDRDVIRTVNVRVKVNYARKRLKNKIIQTIVYFSLM
jgi:hypothetical protein